MSFIQILWNVLLMHGSSLIGISLVMIAAYIREMLRRQREIVLCVIRLACAFFFIKCTHVHRLSEPSA